MGMFVYRALTSNGQVVSGLEDATTMRAASERLQARNLMPIEVREDKEKTSILSRILPRRIPSELRLQALGHLSSLLNAGLSLTLCLRTIADQIRHDGLRRVLRDISTQVQQGKTFTESLETHGELFPPIHRSMIRAGEESGHLSDVLDRLVEHTEREQVLKRKVVEASTYPVIVICIAVVIVGLLLTFVVPKFVEVLQQGDRELPGPTRVLMAISAAFRQYGLFGLGVLVLGGLGMPGLLRRPGFRLKWDRSLLHIPVVGDLLKKAAIARFAHTLGTLLESGLPLLTSLRLTAPVLGNLALEQILMKTVAAIESGEDLTAPIRREPLFPPMVVQMIAVGEASGSLELMLGKIGKMYDKEVEAAARRLMLVLEPALIVVLGVIVAYVALALLLPMLNAVSGLRR